MEATVTDGHASDEAAGRATGGNSGSSVAAAASAGALSVSQSHNHESIP